MGHEWLWLILMIAGIVIALAGAKSWFERSL